MLLLLVLVMMMMVILIAHGLTCASLFALQPDFENRKVRDLAWCGLFILFLIGMVREAHIHTHSPPINTRAAAAAGLCYSSW